MMNFLPADRWTPEENGYSALKTALTNKEQKHSQCFLHSSKSSSSHDFGGAPLKRDTKDQEMIRHGEIKSGTQASSCTTSARQEQRENMTIVACL